MNGPIAQIVALTCYGNASLQGTDVDEFFPKNSTCMFCDRVTFVTFEKPLLGKPQEKEVAKSPDEWFKFMRSADAKGIRLFRSQQNDPHISDRMSAGFVGGGGSWSMEVLLPNNRGESWIARWDVWNQDAPDQRIWRVTYGRASQGAAVKTGRHDLQGTATQLTRALREILSFSTTRDCGGFTQYFADALDTLDSGGTNLHGYHKDLAPDGYLSHLAQTILHACQRAWVFGGMGSWNDMGFDGDDQTEYERVSEQLFEELNEAIPAAANESCYRLEQGAEGDAASRAP